MVEISLETKTIIMTMIVVCDKNINDMTRVSTIYLLVLIASFLIRFQLFYVYPWLGSALEPGGIHRGLGTGPYTAALGARLSSALWLKDQTTSVDTRN